MAYLRLFIGGVISEEREAVWGTHKSLLLSDYRFADGATLLCVNIHAINFRENSTYHKEKDRLRAFLSGYEGALIVAGDFNTWNGERMRKLLETSEELGLKRVPYTQGVKQVLGRDLDFVFYRDLELLEYRVDESHMISDHHPLYARFKR